MNELIKTQNNRRNQHARWSFNCFVGVKGDEENCSKFNNDRYDNKLFVNVNFFLNRVSPYHSYVRNCFAAITLRDNIT